MALSRRPYLHADHVRQLELDRLNWLHVGAALRGGYVSIEDEDHATELREADEKARMEEWKKGPFVKRMWVQDEQRESFRLITVGLDSMARSASGEPVSFVPASTISEYNLGPIIKIPETVFNTASAIMSCTEAVDITWMGSDKVERQDRWVVLPVGSGIRMPLLGERFMTCFGQLLLSVEPTGTIAVASDEDRPQKKGGKPMMGGKGASSKKPVKRDNIMAHNPDSAPASQNVAGRQAAQIAREQRVYEDFVSSSQHTNQPTANRDHQTLAYYDNFRSYRDARSLDMHVTEREHWAAYWQLHTPRFDHRLLIPTERELRDQAGLPKPYSKGPPRK
ncbi:hypothetical protein QC762_0082300 [Podospora pseudocomata]|uniref:RecQ mediated genome instability protein 1 N-terminal domain-containing protein n=1 Tax=Podospora pseudocomata TaxID=2093779 RepID=A0ABR0GC24_9PEZI|nr:hypothetical protein QC762_0082300 [Podospora pseudocomata]